jgi:hypothetical protein
MQASLSCTDPPKKTPKKSKEQKEWLKLELHLISLQQFSCTNFNTFGDMELHYCASTTARQSESPRELMEQLESLPNFKWNELKESTIHPYLSLQKNLELALLDMASFSIGVLGKSLVSHTFCLHNKHGLTSEEDLLGLPEPPSHDPWEDVCLPIIIPREKKEKIKEQTANHQNQVSEVSEEVSEKVSRMKQSNDLVHSDPVKQFRKAIQKVSKTDRAKTTLSKRFGTYDTNDQEDKHALLCCNIALNICKDLNIWSYGFIEVAKIHKIPLTPRIFKLEKKRIAKLKETKVETDVGIKMSQQQLLIEKAIKGVRDIVIKKKKISEFEVICSCCELPLYICQTLFVWHFKMPFIKSLYCNDLNTSMKKPIRNHFFEVVFTFV